MNPAKSSSNGSVGGRTIGLARDTVELRILNLDHVIRVITHRIRSRVGSRTRDRFSAFVAAAVPVPAVVAALLRDKVRAKRLPAAATVVRSCGGHLGIVPHRRNVSNLW
uniref:Uncharacterized protein n=1 Tax=Anopheles culicifacies TaxID=139723 RepID=A0A182LVA2_9DIPT